MILGVVVFFFGLLSFFFLNNLLIFWVVFEVLSFFLLLLLVLEKAKVHFKGFMKLFLVQLFSGLLFFLFLIMVDGTSWFFLFFFILIKLSLWPGHLWVFNVFPFMSFKAFMSIFLILKLPVFILAFWVPLMFWIPSLIMSLSFSLYFLMKSKSFVMLLLSTNLGFSSFSLIFSFFSMFHFFVFMVYLMTIGLFILVGLKDYDFESKKSLFVVFLLAISSFPVFTSFFYKVLVLIAMDINFLFFIFVFLSSLSIYFYFLMSFKILLNVFNKF